MNGMATADRDNTGPSASGRAERGDVSPAQADLVGDVLDYGRRRLALWRSSGDLVRLETQLAAQAGIRLVGCVLAGVGVGSVGLLWLEGFVAYLLWQVAVPVWGIALVMIVTNILLALLLVRAVRTYARDLRFDRTRTLLREASANEEGA